jgi:RimJ/RimL family protein N-acetyltransferase
MTEHQPPETRIQLILRPWQVADAEGLRAAIDEDIDHIRPWLSWTVEEPATLDRTRERLADYVRQFRAGQAFRYAVTPAGVTTTILGGVSLNTRVGPAAHDLGYWVRKSATGRGIEGAAASAVIVHAFEARSVERVVAQCDVENANSASFARHLGFEYLRAVQAEYPDGAPRPLLQFEMDRDAYLTRHRPVLRTRALSVRLAPGPAPA